MIFFGAKIQIKYLFEFSRLKTLLAPLAIFKIENETFTKDFQPLWIDVRFFKYFFPLWKIVKNDDFFVMGDDNLNAKNTFRKIMDFPGKQTFK